MAEAAENQPDAGDDETFTPEEARYFETQGGEVPEGEGQPEAGGDDQQQPGSDDQKPAGEGGDQPADKAAADQPPPGYVPVKALQEMREERKQLLARLEALEKGQQPQKPEEDPDPEPDKDSDFGAWLEWKDRQADTKLQQVQETLKQQQEAQQKREAIQGIMTEVGRQEAEFRASHDDYDQAYDFAREHERRRLQEVEGITDKAKQDQILAEIEQKFVMGALQGGENPAAALYRYAKWAGYQRQDKPANPDAPAAGQQTARREPPKSLGAARTAPAGDALTPEALAQMTDAQFEQLAGTAKGREQINKIMGEGFVSEY